MAATDQTITGYRGEDWVIPFAPPTPTPCPDAMAFTVAVYAEGPPVFAELTVGAGITITDQPDGEYLVRVPRATTGIVPVGEYVFSVFDLDGDRELLASGQLFVKASARRPD